MLLGALGVLRVSVKTSWGVLGCLEVLLGCSWGALGVLLGCFGDLLVVLRVPGCAYGSRLKPRWVFLDPLRVVNMRIRARTQQNVKQSACGM